MRSQPSPPRSRTRGQRTATGPMPVMISRSGRCPWRTNRRRPSSISLSAWQLSKLETSASTACARSARAPLRKTSVSGSVKVPGCESWKTLVSVTAYHSFAGEVEASNTPTIRRLTPSRRHQLSPIAQELLPRLSRVAVVWNAANPYSARVFEETQRAAETLAIELQSLEVRSPDDFDGAFDTARRKHIDALVAVEDPLTFNRLKQIAEFCVDNRLPAVYGLREFAEAGGLMTYGASSGDLFRRAVGFVDKILRGAEPADLPVQQPTKFELVINLKTAKALGLQIPDRLLARADEVIE